MVTFSVSFHQKPSFLVHCQLQSSRCVRDVQMINLRPSHSNTRDGHPCDGMKPMSLTFCTLQMSHPAAPKVPETGRDLQGPPHLSAAPAQTCQSKLQPLLGLQLGLLLLERHHEALDWEKIRHLQSKYPRRRLLDTIAKCQTMAFFEDILKNLPLWI